MNDLQDRAALVAEVTDLADTNIAGLNRYCDALSERQLGKDAEIAPSTVFDRTDELISGAKQCWRDSVAYVSDEHVTDWDAFSQVMLLTGIAIKETAAAHALLLRHTPTLRGFPSELAPAQTIESAPQTNTVDYLRGGYILFQTPDAEEKTVTVDLPILGQAADRLQHLLYPALNDAKSLSFTCGIAGLDSAMDVMATYSMNEGRLNYIGNNCWIEIRKRLKIRDQRFFKLYDDTAPDAAAELILRDDVQSVFIEGIQNHPDMRACDLRAVAAAVKQITTDKPKYVIVDNVAIVSVVSGIKFIQYGTDRAKTGLVTIGGTGTVPRQVESDLVEARAESGRAPSYEDVFGCAVDTSASLKGRMSRYDRNIKIMAQDMGEFCDATPGPVLHSLWSEQHPDHDRAMDDYGHGGRFLYLRLDLEGVDENALTLELYRYIADEAARKHLPLIAASSFGFAIPTSTSYDTKTWAFRFGCHPAACA